MKPLHPFFRAAAVPLLLPVLGLPWSACADTAVATAAVPANAPKSVFHSQPGFGKDPFFPRSTRLIPVTPIKVDPSTFNSGVPDFITLKGLSVMNQRKLAIINNHTVAEGEGFNLRVNGGFLKVKCIEIKESSVIIDVNGATKELQLRPGL